MKLSESKYESLGVSASKSGLHSVLKSAGVEDSLGLFAKVTPDLAGDPDYYSVVHCDGAGTKTIVPYLYYKACGDPSLFAHLAQDALVMNLDDIYCIGAPQHLVLANAIARNARLIDDVALEQIITSYRDLVASLRALGVPLEMSGGETADCGDVVRTLIVDAVISGRIKKSDIIDANRITSGDVIVGFSSTGKASYESKENSGIGSNGLTLARHTLLSSKNVEQHPEIVDPATSKELAYHGPYVVQDTPDELSGLSIGEALSSPTRTYAPVLQKLFAELGTNVHGVIHLTGGGQTKMLRFGQGNRFVKDDLFPTPALFGLIQKHGQVDWKEMYQVFNMGHRLEVYLPEQDAQKAISIAEHFSIDAKVVGRVEQNPNSGTENELLLTTSNGEFHYSL